jgi:hypothetical protein
MNLDAGRGFKIESKTNTATTLLTNATTGPSYWLLVFKGRNRCFARRVDKVTYHSFAAPS